MKRAVLLGALLAGMLWNLRLAVADFAARRNDAAWTRVAMRAAPENGAYAAQMAEEVYASDPAEARLLLQRAVRLNRFDAGSWIQLGLLQEAGNDLPQAERSLLEAARADKTFLPGWSLANYYFRHQQTDRFWFWAQNAAQMVAEDASALFRLAWYASPDARVIEDRLQIRRPAVESQLVQFFMSQGDARAVSEAAEHLLAANDAGSSATLVSACDWLLGERRPDLALALWNGVAPRIGSLPAGGEGVVTNGGFQRPPSSHGFDWRVAAVDGVSSYRDDHPAALGFDFSGDEPDSFTLLAQTIAVAPGKPYRLLVEYATDGIAPGSGVSWTIREEPGGGVLRRTAALSAQQGGEAEACFTLPEGSRFARLSLDYQRQPGTVRVQGRLALKQVRVTAGGCGEKKNLTFGADSPWFERLHSRTSEWGHRSLPATDRGMTAGLPRRIKAPETGPDGFLAHPS